MEEEESDEEGWRSKTPRDQAASRPASASASRLSQKRRKRRRSRRRFRRSRRRERRTVDVSCILGGKAK